MSNADGQTERNSSKLLTPLRTGSSGSTASSQDPLHHFSCHIGQAIIPTIVVMGQSFMIEPQEVEDRGVEVMNMDAVAADADAQVIGSPVDGSLLHPGPSHPG